jgi:hypothetical protein
VSNITHKTKVKKLLIQRDLDGILHWANTTRNPQRVLFSLVYDANELVKWRAIEATGKVAVILAKKGYEKIRNLIRQQLWLMNDESGGLGWHSPEIIGEILVNVPPLIYEYGQLLMAFFKEEPFERGSHLAVYRVASINPKLYAYKTKDLIASLNQPDKYIQAYTILALGEIDSGQVKKVEKSFSNDTEKIQIYDFKTGQLVSTDLKRIVEKVLDGSEASIDAA